MTTFKKALVAVDLVATIAVIATVGVIVYNILPLLAA